MLALVPILMAMAQPSLAAGQAGAPVPAPPPPATSTAAAGVKGTSSEVVCRHEATTGTRLAGPQVCRTRGEWADMAAQAREATQAYQNQRAYSPH